MFFSKSTLILSVLALGNIVAAAQPPACLLSVVGSEKNPSDLKAVCVTNTDNVQQKISDRCGDNEEAALKWYSDNCSGAGYKVEVNTSTTSSGSHATGTSSKGSTVTNSGFVTATATGSGNSGSSSSSSGSSGSSSSNAASPSQTVSAGSSDRHVSAAAFAAVVFMGFAATLAVTFLKCTFRPPFLFYLFKVPPWIGWNLSHRIARTYATNIYISSTSVNAGNSIVEHWEVKARSRNLGI
ncbi:putative GPI anchored cell wall protein [Aspergillus clavatus NRRL 1]|uniref:GPI anchored cell wall protein n=1 Tax=Aspergillus clavatus (strain ATCC 1007 / CBS 513.65 / DSM 816 / NCTC 3887 / NRRL 1 / QM 1276 / 107) TaxID=344612 RepID=A1CGX4_ASPCL|nr:uncharacterized protein ACLA_045940 [Aspergillus clavatus NRRL 1]EAW10129.1 hypothetical protein ACLA_045940 [Aspergillus clavatus NRRL 1]